MTKRVADRLRRAVAVSSLGIGPALCLVWAWGKSGDSRGYLIGMLCVMVVILAALAQYLMIRVRSLESAREDFDHNFDAVADRLEGIERRMDRRPEAP